MAINLQKLFSFTSWSRSHPTEPLPGDKVDTEFADVRSSLGQLETQIASVRRSDGKLVNGVVDQTSLSPTLLDTLSASFKTSIQSDATAAQAARTQAQTAASSAQASATSAASSAASAAASAAVVSANANATLQQIQTAQASAIALQSTVSSAASSVDNAANDAEGSAAVAHAWGDVAHAWAEHLPGTIPPNILAVMGITGDHWSARWWANYAAQAVSDTAIAVENIDASVAEAAASAATATTAAQTATTKASAASSSATSAAASATSATSSATSATTSATTATTKASEAAASATSATTSATTATTKASEAAASASTATTKALEAAASATSASSSASTAQTARTAAQAAQVAAESARDATLAAFDSFDDRYLGVKAADPTADNDGNALLAGALYFSSTANSMKVYTGSAWVAAYVSGAGTLIAANNLSDVTSASSARANLGVAIGSNVQAWDADLDAIAALAGTSGLLKKTAANTWTLDTTSYLSGSVSLTSGVTGTLPVANGGTGLTSLTAGYIPFGNGTGALGASSSLFWDNTTGSLGVGTGSPGTKLNVYSGSAANTFVRSQNTLAYADFGPLSDGSIYGPYCSPATSTGLTIGTANANPIRLYTNATERMRIDANGRLGLGTAPFADTSGISIASPLTGGTTINTANIYANVQSDVTANARGFLSQIGTAAATFTLGNLSHFRAKQLTFGAGSTVTNQMGFFAENNLTGATNNYGFYSDIASGTGRWNFYAGGTADNYFAGNVGIGTSSPTARFQVSGSTTINGQANVAAVVGANVTSELLLGSVNGNTPFVASSGAYPLMFATNATERMRIDSAGNVGIGTSSTTGANFRIGSNISGAATSWAVYVNNTIDTASVTSTGHVFRTSVGVNAGGASIGTVSHYSANQGTFSLAPTNQFGFLVESSLTGATNNYGFYSNIAAGTGRWNFYANGTAANYFGGVTTIAAGLNEKRTAPAISAGTLSLDCSAGNIFTVSLNANITTFSFSNVPAAGTAYGLTLMLTADGTARTVTWPASVKWPGGTAPTLTSTTGKVDTFVLVTHDGGTTWYAYVGGQNS